MCCSIYIIHQSFDFVNDFVRFKQVYFENVVEKSGNVWYNALKSEGKLPYKSEFYEVKNNENKAISK